VRKTERKKAPARKKITERKRVTELQTTDLETATERKTAMNKPSDIFIDGLVEGVGQELKPFGSQSPSPLSPMQPQDGQWAFRFNYTEAKVTVFVKVNFGPPFSMSNDLFSEMREPQVESLRNWLDRVLKVMKEVH